MQPPPFLLTTRTWHVRGGGLLERISAQRNEAGAVRRALSPTLRARVLSCLTRSPCAAKQVEAKYPALLFKQQLTAFVEKIYGMVRDNVKREITTELGQCIQVRVGEWQRRVSVRRGQCVGGPWGRPP